MSPKQEKQMAIYGVIVLFLSTGVSGFLGTRYILSLIKYGIHSENIARKIYSMNKVIDSNVISTSNELIFQFAKRPIPWNASLSLFFFSCAIFIAVTMAIRATKD